ncbi:type IX secretion system protein PorQ [Reichenbachiella versicolor]|uniref:type IX secretion system protein PorQ n=1 Tax=Reichenbachiella versicolor TaxID=1821036 RepID=UPI000D6E25A2|nr:type IX secretion system protein PorQ [Reichenbachiella versicolor]
MKIFKLVFLTLLVGNTSFLFAQLGGKQSFEFLNLPIGARVAGLGGVGITSTESDVNLFMSNPAMLDSMNHNHISWSYFGFYADVKYNTLAYSFNHKGIGPIGFGIQRLGYGQFEGFDEVGNSTGTFKGGETAVVISKSHQISVFRMGLSLKYINSSIENFNSSALAFDLGGTFIHPSREFMAGLLIKNIGFTLSDYTSTSNAEVPIDVQIGFTYKPEHMPFRLTGTVYNLNKPNSTYDDSSEGTPTWFDKGFRHVNLGVEIVFSQNFQVRTGYNHLLRKELSLEEKAGMTGLTLGVMAKIKAFEISYTLASYHVDGGRSYFTITSNLNKVFKKKSIL